MLFLFTQNIFIQYGNLLGDLNHVSVTNMQKKQKKKQEGGKYFFIGIYIKDVEGVMLNAK